VVFIRATRVVFLQTWGHGQQCKTKRLLRAHSLQSFLFNPACRQRQGQQKSISASIPAMRSGGSFFNFVEN